MQQRVMRAVAFAAVLVAACTSVGPEAVIRTAAGPVEVRLEVVATPETRARGLMYRDALGEGDGMLFVFDEDSDHEFWMKNTLIPLDMIFIAADGHIVGVRADAKPLSLALIGVGQPSRFVLEVPAGWAARHGVAAGQHVELRGVPAP